MSGKRREALGEGGLGTGRAGSGGDLCGCVLDGRDRLFALWGAWSVCFVFPAALLLLLLRGGRGGGRSS